MGPIHIIYRVAFPAYQNSIPMETIFLVEVVEYIKAGISAIWKEEDEEWK